MIHVVTGPLSLSLAAIWRNRGRSALTILGVLIGVASVVLVTALSAAAADLVGSQIDRYGTNALFVTPSQLVQAGKKISPRLTEADGAAIVRDANSVAAIAPLLSATVQVIFGNRNAATAINGTKLPYFGIRKFKVRRGKTWTEQDEALRARVCVLGAVPARKLFGDSDPVGQTIRIRNFPFMVTGVLEPKGGDQSEDDRVLIPIGSFRGRVGPTPPGRVEQFLASATTAQTTSRAEAQVRRVLRERHGLGFGIEDDFKIESMAELRRIAEAVATALSMLLLGVAAISLAVGGVGIMNIMLVSVSERTREIGIRLSLGASEGDILAQFMVEAIVLSLIGGVLGIVAGLACAFGLGFALDWRIVPNGTALGLALVTSASIGVFFGYVPAKRAARMDPVDALRSD